MFSILISEEKTMPRKKKTKWSVPKGSRKRNTTPAEENVTLLDTATQSTDAFSDTATTQGTIVLSVVNETSQPQPTPKRKNPNLPTPGPVRRSKRIRSRSSSVGEEAGIAVATTSTSEVNNATSMYNIVDRPSTSTNAWTTCESRSDVPPGIFLQLKLLNSIFKTI